MAAGHLDPQASWQPLLRRCMAARCNSRRCHCRRSHWQGGLRLLLTCLAVLSIVPALLADCIKGSASGLLICLSWHPRHFIMRP